MTLSHRLSQAATDQQRELIEELFVALNPQPEKKMSGDGIVWLLDDMAFRAMLDCGAYLDAVMLMVPDGWWVRWMGRPRQEDPCGVILSGGNGRAAGGENNEAALALASAIAAAKGV